jgi:hypothetical protein
VNETTVDRDLRVASGALLGAAALWSALPVHPPLACPLRSTTGIPCPFCGMTRACAALAHGHLAGSLTFNPGGILVIAIAIAFLVRPAWVRSLRPPLWLVGVSVGLLWLWNIGFNPTFHQLLLR